MMTERDMEGTDVAYLGCLAFAWRDLGKPRKYFLYIYRKTY
jgi:hypothetical protein